jgi:SM-20-related protein
VAYVFSFTKNWKIDWGGLLQFHDDENCKIIDSYVPAFNALTIFRVPQWHSVSYVTPFAMGPRYAVAGWYHGDKSAA